jgi:hypothetical protein
MCPEASLADSHLQPWSVRTCLPSSTRPVQSAMPRHTKCTHARHLAHRCLSPPPSPPRSAKRLAKDFTARCLLQSSLRVPAVRRAVLAACTRHTTAAAAASPQGGLQGQARGSRPADSHSCAVSEVWQLEERCSVVGLDVG